MNAIMIASELFARHNARQLPSDTDIRAVGPAAEPGMLLTLTAARSIPRRKTTRGGRASLRLVMRALPTLRPGWSLLAEPGWGTAGEGLCRRRPHAAAGLSRSPFLRAGAMRGWVREGFDDTNADTQFPLSSAVIPVWYAAENLQEEYFQEPHVPGCNAPNGCAAPALRGLVWKED
jgi:hypothetical protein